ncbi:MAG: tetratricopeptide repeat protein, partial [Synergistaceae bacterium]|nr:tetratricopeptide repeat protein [Synergistaceae bacterium]
NRGNDYKILGQKEKAIADYTAAIEIASQYADAYCNRGNLYNESGEYEKAIEDYSAVIKIRPKDADAYNNRGVAYYQSGEYEKAAEDFKKARKLNPKNETFERNVKAMRDKISSVPKEQKENQSSISDNPE